MEYCYAVIMDNGVVKFGKTTKIKERLIQHYSIAVSMKVGVVGALVSHVSDADESERSLLGAARASLTQMHGNEYFNYESIYEVFHVMNEALGGYVSFEISASEYPIVIKLVSHLSPPMADKGDGKIDYVSKVFELIRRSEGITEGVIFNKLRSYDSYKIIGALHGLLGDGLIRVVESTHAKNQIVFRKYYICEK